MNKIDTTRVLTKNEIFRKGEMNFVNTFKGDFELKCWGKNQVFERDGRKRRRNVRSNARTERLRFLNFSKFYQ